MAKEARLKNVACRVFEMLQRRDGWLTTEQINARIGGDRENMLRRLNQMVADGTVEVRVAVANAKEWRAVKALT